MKTDNALERRDRTAAKNGATARRDDGQQSSLSMLKLCIAVYELFSLFMLLELATFIPVESHIGASFKGFSCNHLCVPLDALGDILEKGDLLPLLVNGQLWINNRQSGVSAQYAVAIDAYVVAVVGAGETALSRDGELVEGSVLKRDGRLSGIPNAFKAKIEAYLGSLVDTSDNLILVLELGNLAADDTNNDGLALGQES